MDLDNDELEATRKMPCNQIKYDLKDKKDIDKMVEENKNHIPNIE